MLKSENRIRIIPRLDVKGPNLVKGICFDGYRVLGRPEDFARQYANDMADEIILYDVMASLVQRSFNSEIISRVADELFIPLTVAGGIRSISDIREILLAGADKVAINTAAVKNPELLRDAALIFGSQCIVSSIEAFRHGPDDYEVWVDYGRQPTGKDVFQWAEEVVSLGAGEILLTSIDRDGTGDGFDIALTERLASSVPVPVIAGGGAGQIEDFTELVDGGEVFAVSAASVFHYYLARPTDSRWMSYDKPELRMGSDIDSGNIEFINDGYGGLRDTPVQPMSIASLKQGLKSSNFSVRL
jgi:imidazole glycerol-phosphate synthase subunit HisF